MKFLLFVITILFPVQAMAIVDQTPNLMGFYFDLEADNLCIDGAAPYSTHTLYLVITNLQADEIYGFEAGYSLEGQGMVLETYFANPTATDLGVPGNHIVGFGNPTLSGPFGVTLLATLTVMYMDTLMGPLHVRLHGTDPSSFHPQFPVVVLEDDDYLGVCYADGTTFNGGCYWLPVVICPDILSPVSEPNFMGLSPCELEHNFPNPFNPSTTISYNLPEAQQVNLSIYSLDGRRIRSLVAGSKPAGRHDVVWDGKDDKGRVVSSGNYFYRIETVAFSDTRKMVLMK